MWLCARESEVARITEISCLYFIWKRLPSACLCALRWCRDGCSQDDDESDEEGGGGGAVGGGGGGDGDLGRLDENIILVCKRARDTPVIRRRRDWAQRIMIGSAC